MINLTPSDMEDIKEFFNDKVESLEDEKVKIEKSKNSLITSIPGDENDDNYYEEDKLRIEKKLRHYKQLVGGLEEELDKFHFHLVSGASETKTEKKDDFGTGAYDIPKSFLDGSFTGGIKK
jgi:hypothetical protein